MPFVPSSCLLLVVMPWLLVAMAGATNCHTKIVLLAYGLLRRLLRIRRLAEPEIDQNPPKVFLVALSSPRSRIQYGF